MEILTDEIAKSLITGLAKLAKKTRSETPHSQEFAQTLVMIGPEMESAVVPITWRNEDEKYAKFRLVSEVAKRTFAQAVAFISDTRFMDSGKASRLLGIPPVEEIGVKAFKKAYSKALHEKFDGYLGNAPPEFYTEAILVVIKGPMLKDTFQVFMPYEPGPNDTIRWLDENPLEKIAVVEFRLLPAWWQ